MSDVTVNLQNLVSPCTYLPTLSPTIPEPLIRKEGSGIKQKHLEGVSKSYVSLCKSKRGMVWLQNSSQRRYLKKGRDIWDDAST